ncbi:MAG: hypothetical protein A2144_00145 [Chloroflexi bacterium RBG_16_50_9]|nr:MAG: hypothetical protein A2144_00145 [Chloroflexi bacterium RBG_16_50_9]
MNSWNKLPADIKKMIEDLEPWYTENRIAKEVAGGRNGEKVGRDKGHSFYELEPGEGQKYLNAAKPIHDDWIKRVEGVGKPGKALYDELKRLIREYS